MSLEKSVSIIKHVTNEFVNRSKVILKDDLVGIYRHQGCM